MSEEIKLLVIDDDEADRLHLKRALRTCGFSYALTEYDDAHQISDSLNNFDCIFLDYLLPGENGLLLLKKMRDNGIKTPIVIITSQGNESIAVELMKAGASDYIVKNDINGLSLGQVLRNMIRMTQMLREREEAEHALRISESRLAEAQRIAKVGNWEYTHDTGTVYWSSEIFNIFGVPLNGLPSLAILFRSVHPDDLRLVKSIWMKAIRRGEFNIDFRINTPVGLKYVHAQGYGYLNTSGRPEKLVGTLQDITDRKLGEQEILKARELAENSMKVKEIFLANMSHEIRTPMNAILGFTRLLYETELSEEQKTFVDAIHFSGENLLVVINDVLDLSKIQSGKMTIEKHEFNIVEFITGILNVLRPKAEEKGLRLISKIDPLIPSVIRGDAVRLNQILTNLISNAIKFTEEGSVSLEVTSRDSQNHNEFFEFKVRDTGIGIPDEKQTLIFDSFVQASDDTTRKYGGTGLGLSIVKSLVAIQEGKITLESEPGQGSVFTVHLAFEKVVVKKPAASSPLVTAGNSFEQIQDAFILVVEDNIVNQLLVKKVLAKTGCRIDIATNGVQAVELVKANDYDLILMDLQMPEMDGYETTEYIRTKLQSPKSHVPIIAMTAHAFGSDVTKCIAVGMNDYISKPFKSQDLYTKIIKHYNKKDRQRVVGRPLSLGKPAEGNVEAMVLDKIKSNDQAVLNKLMMCDQHAHRFIESLKGFLKVGDFEGIESVCREARVCFALLKMNDLEHALDEVVKLVQSENRKDEMVKITNLVSIIVSLVSMVSEEVKRSLRKTG
ncbi:MAG TPA: response regulator [Ohtaekwangia sp.]|nr:response regulator [Ohtaekwangia sp.]